MSCADNTVISFLWTISTRARQGPLLMEILYQRKQYAHGFHYGKIIANHIIVQRNLHAAILINANNLTLLQQQPIACKLLCTPCATLYLAIILCTWKCNIYTLSKREGSNLHSKLWAHCQTAERNGIRSPRWCDTTHCGLKSWWPLVQTSFTG